MTTSPLDDLFGAQGGGDFLDVPGSYEFEVTKAEAKASANGKPQLKLTMKIANGPQEGKTLIHTLTYSPESEMAKSILWRSLQALGITQEFAQQVAANLPAGAMINTLFLEAAKVIVGRHVTAVTAKDSGNPIEEYRERVKVQFDLKPVKTAAPVPPPVVQPEPVTQTVTTSAPAEVTMTVSSDDAPPF
jgi:hypothetical protein